MDNFVRSPSPQPPPLPEPPREATVDEIVALGGLLGRWMAARYAGRRECADADARSLADGLESDGMEEHAEAWAAIADRIGRDEAEALHRAVKAGVAVEIMAMTAYGAEQDLWEARNTRAGDAAD